LCFDLYGFSRAGLSEARRELESAKGMGYANDRWQVRAVGPKYWNKYCGDVKDVVEFEWEDDEEDEEDEEDEKE
jgi:hypothetical protein